MKKVCLSFFEKHTFFSALDTRAFSGKKGPLGPSRKSQQQTKRTGFAAL